MRVGGSKPRPSWRIFRCCFMTALSDSEHVVEAAAGGIDYVTKPIRTDEVPWPASPPTCAPPAACARPASYRPSARN